MLQVCISKNILVGAANAPSISMHFMAFEHFARSARLAPLSAATPTFLSIWYTLWASVFLGIGVARFLLMCDFLKDLSTALARKGKKWYSLQSKDRDNRRRFR